MEGRELATALARGRIAIGAAALLAPGLAARLMLGPNGSRPGMKLLARMLGGRDLALGLGVVIALDRGAPVRGWLEAGAFADGVDFAGCLLSREEMTPTAFASTVALAGGAALAGLWLSRQLDPPPSATPGHPEAIVTGHAAEAPATAQQEL